MTQQDNFLDQIRQLENGGTIQSTKDYVGSRKLAIDISSKIFRPSIFLKLLVLIFGLIILAIAIVKTFQPKSLTNSEIGGLVIAYVLSFILSINAIRQFITDKTMNFQIRIDNSGISIDETVYKWTEIYETAIMKKFAGKSTYKYLVIALNNKSTYECYDLTNFVNLNPRGFSVTLAKYIEYFKPTRH